MRYSSRFFLYAPFLSFVALAVGVMVWWWFAASALNTQLVAANGHEIAPGIEFSFTGKKIAGFPFRLDTILDELRIEIATSRGPLVWRAEHFASHRLTYGPGQTIYEAAGRQEFTWRDADGAHDFVFVPGTMRASAIVTKKELAQFDLDIVEIASPDLGAGRFQFHLRRDPALDALDIASSGDTIHLAPHLQSGLGDTIKHFVLIAHLAPGSPFAALLGAKAEWRNAAEGWRSHGGKFVIDKFAAQWGPLDANGQGTLALDDTHRLTGDLALSMKGASALLVSARKYPDLAGAITSLVMQDQNAARGILPVPLTFKNGTVSAGNNPAGAIGPLYRARCDEKVPERQSSVTNHLYLRAPSGTGAAFASATPSIIHPSHS